MPFAIIAIFVFIALPCAILWWIGRSIFQALQKPKRVAAANAERERRARAICDYFDEVERSRSFPEESAGINIQLHEFVVCNAPASLYEYRTQRSSTGAAVRVARGVYVGGRQQHSHESLREVATGQLVVTNQRIVYLSTQRTSTIKLNDILSIDGDHSFLEVHSSKRQKPVLLEVSGFDTALVALLVKLFTTGKFEGRFLSEDIHLAPHCGLNGEVSVNVSRDDGMPSARHLPA